MAVSSVLHSPLLQGFILPSLTLLLAVLPATSAFVCQERVYAFVNTPRSFEDAARECSLLGTSWTLAVVLRAADVTCVHTHTRGHTVWLGLRTTNSRSQWITGQALSLDFFPRLQTSLPASNYCTAANSSFAAGVPNWIPAACSRLLPYLCQQRKTTNNDDSRNKFDIWNTYQLAFICIAGGLLIIVIIMAISLFRTKNKKTKPLTFPVSPISRSSQTKPDNWIREETPKVVDTSEEPTADSVFSEKSEASAKYDMEDWEDNPFYAHVDKPEKQKAGPTNSVPGQTVQGQPPNLTHVRLNCYENASAESNASISTSHVSVTTSFQTGPARYSVGTLVNVRGSSCGSEAMNCDITCASDRSGVSVAHPIATVQESNTSAGTHTSSSSTSIGIDSTLIERSKVIDKSSTEPLSSTPTSSEPGFFKFVRKYTKTLATKISQTALLDAECGQSPSSARSVVSIGSSSEAADGVQTSAMSTHCELDEQTPAVYTEVVSKKAAVTDTYGTPSGNTLTAKGSQTALLDAECSLLPATKSCIDQSGLYDRLNGSCGGTEQSLEQTSTVSTVTGNSVLDDPKPVAYTEVSLQRAEVSDSYSRLSGKTRESISKDELYNEASQALLNLDKELDMIGLDDSVIVIVEENLYDMYTEPHRKGATDVNKGVDATLVEQVAFNALDELDRTLDAQDKTLDDQAAFNALDELDRTLDDHATSNSLDEADTAPDDQLAIDVLDELDRTLDDLL